MKITYAVFAKPWKNLTILELAKHIKKLGFEWIELPVRPGFACEPDNIETSLPMAITLLADEGVHVLNVTAANPLTDERLYVACLRAGIRMNRVMFDRREGENYWKAEARARKKLDEAMPLCERYGFQIGIQNHYGLCVPVNAMGMHNLVKEYDPKYVGAIWDPAHNALEGEASEPALDIVSSHLCIVNLKNAYWKVVAESAADSRDWEVYWATGRQGRASWPQVAAKLKRMDYSGAVCLSAEYSESHRVDSLIVEDLAYAQACFSAAENLPFASPER